MQRIVYVSGVLGLAMVLNGCNDTNHRSVPRYEDLPVVKESDGVVRRSKLTGNSTGAIRRGLYQQYQIWKRTRYRLGGMSKRGIDCSRFVHVVYRNQFGIKLPLNTYQQHSFGHRVEKHQLRAGDLIFFRTGFYTNHVGIYLKGGKFMHASVTEGVTISYLDEDYWRDKFWKAKRIIGR